MERQWQLSISLMIESLLLSVTEMTSLSGLNCTLQAEIVCRDHAQSSNFPYQLNNTSGRPMNIPQTEHLRKLNPALPYSFLLFILEVDMYWSLPLHSQWPRFKKAHTH